jgi:5-methylcytosine-specific restriction endonuclease McrA
MTAMTHQPITLLNASYEVLSANLSLQKAARLLSLGKATVEESDDSGRFLRDWAWPKVLRLTYHVKVAYNRIYGPPRVSKRGVLTRDQNVCAFGECKNHASTIDHVQPRSRGGQNTWQNLVAACSSCNHKKGNRTPQEAGMTLKWKPYVPTKAQLFSPSS